jgi:hypothetical protein
MQSLGDFLTERVHKVLAKRLPHQSLKGFWLNLVQGSPTMTRSNFDAEINKCGDPLSSDLIDIIWANTGAPQGVDSQLTYRDFVQFALLDEVDLTIAPRLSAPVFPEKMIQARGRIYVAMVRANQHLTGKVMTGEFKEKLKAQCTDVDPLLCDEIAKKYETPDGTEVDYFAFLCDLCHQISSSTIQIDSVGEPYFPSTQWRYGPPM